MIIGISSKIGSGKDTVGKIIQYLVDIGNSKANDEIPSFNAWKNDKVYELSTWKTVKFADKVKDIVCLIIGCTREQLEDETFKNTKLGSEWNRYELHLLHNFNRHSKSNKIFNSYKEANTYAMDSNYVQSGYVINTVKLTPRILLQKVGTDFGRNIIHPNIWINATMRDYKLTSLQYMLLDYSNPNNKSNKEYIGEKKIIEVPNWIITDVRFPNEAKAILDRGGFIIRLTRTVNWRDKAEHNFATKGITPHISETALDNYNNFKYIINNSNYSIKELIKEVKQILVKENII